MSNSAFFLRYPIDFQHICLVYPPSIKEVVTAEDFSKYLKILTFSQEEIEDEFVKDGRDMADLLTPLEYILNSAYNNKDFAQLLKNAFFFYIHEPVTFLFEAKQILIGDVNDLKQISSLRLLQEGNYFDFQNLIREANGLKPIEPPNPDENPRIRAMKAKARYRDYIKAKKGLGLKFETLLSSICCMGLGLNPLNIGELSYAAIPVLVHFYQDKEKYDIDIRSLLAGADSKKIKPKYWIQNSED